LFKNCYIKVLSFIHDNNNFFTFPFLFYQKPVQFIGEGEKLISGKIVNKVISEEKMKLTPGGNTASLMKHVYVFLAAAAIIVIAFFGYQYWVSDRQAVSRSVSDSTIQSRTQHSDPSVVQMPIQQNKPKLQAEKPTPSSDKTRFLRHEAAFHTVALWGESPGLSGSMEGISDNLTYYKQIAKLNGLSLYKLPNSFKLMKQMNLPAIAELLEPASGGEQYVLITGIDSSHVTLYCENGCVNQMPISEIQQKMNGNIFVFWRNFSSIMGIVPDTASGDSVIALKILMDEIGFNDIEMTPEYDAWTEENIRFFQDAYGMDVDGVVGTLTKIMLYNAKDGLSIPHLVSGEGQSETAGN